MNFEKKTLTGVSGVLVFALVLGISAFSVDNSDMMISKDHYGIQSSAGVGSRLWVAAHCLYLK